MCDGDKYNEKLAESMTCGATASLVGKTKWNIQDLPLPGITVDQNQCCIPGAMIEMSTAVRTQRCRGDGGSHTSL